MKTSKIILLAAIVLACTIAGTVQIDRSLGINEFSPITLFLGAFYLMVFIGWIKKRPVVQVKKVRAMSHYLR